MIRVELLSSDAVLSNSIAILVILKSLWRHIKSILQHSFILLCFLLLFHMCSYPLHVGHHPMIHPNDLVQLQLLLFVFLYCSALSLRHAWLMMIIRLVFEKPTSEGTRCDIFSGQKWIMEWEGDEVWGRWYQWRIIGTHFYGRGQCYHLQPPLLIV